LDILTGLAALSQALGIAKELREIDRGLDEAAFKLKLADLQTNLAEAKASLSDAKIELSSKSQRIKELEGELDLAINGDYCPKCRSGRMKLVRTDFHHMYGLGHLGVEEWEFACANEDCGFVQTRLHDPHGAIPAHARKR